MKKVNKNQAFAQGTIEYLVVLGVIIVISLVVVSLMTGFLDTGATSQTVSRISGQVGLFSVSETIVNPEDGNYILVIKSLNSEPVTVTSVEISDGNNTYSESLNLSQGKVFLSPTTTDCTAGQTITANVTITYTTIDGLTKKHILENLAFSCSNSTPNPALLATITSPETETPIEEETGPSCDGVELEEEETCDGEFLNEETCETQLGIGYLGTLACNETCNGFDTSACTLAAIFLTSDTNTFLDSEDLITNIPEYNDANTYIFKWYKNDDLNATTLIESGLVSYWPMNNDNNDYFGSNDGNNNGPTLIAGGKVHKAYYFDGVDDYISVPDSDDLEPNSFTISAWVKTSGMTTQNKIAVSKIDGVKGYQLGLTSDNKPYFSLENLTEQNVVKVNNAMESASNTTGTQGRLPIGASGGDITHASHPAVLKDGNTYKMWYLGYGGSTAKWRIYHATSPDGLTWTKYDNTVAGNCDTVCDGNGKIGLGTGTTGDYDGFPWAFDVIKDENTYKMWYSGNGGSTKYGRIYYATSPDGLTWTKYNNEAPAASDTISTDGRIPVGSASPKGDHAGSLSPAIVKDGNTYKMWYNGNKSSDGANYMATSPDGLNWTKVNNNVPARSDTDSNEGRMTKAATSGRAEYNAIGYGLSVVQDGRVMRAWTGVYKPQWPGLSTLYLYSIDGGYTWLKVDNTQPDASDTTCTKARICTGTSGKGDYYQSAYPSVLKDGATYKLWYGGSNGTNGQIQLATIDTGITGTNALDEG